MIDWEVKTPPKSEPVTVTSLKSHLRIDGDADDTDLASLIESSRLELERATGLAFVTQTRLLRLSLFPVGQSRIYLPGSPLKAINSIKYFDGETQQTWDDTQYILRKGEPGWVQLLPSYSWPAHTSSAYEIEIDYNCGGLVSEVDNRVRTAIKLRCQMDFAELFDAAEYQRVVDSYESFRLQLAIGEEFLTYGC